MSARRSMLTEATYGEMDENAVDSTFVSAPFDWNPLRVFASTSISHVIRDCDCVDVKQNDLEVGGGGLGLKDSTHARNRVVNLAVLRLMRILRVLLGILEFYLVIDGFAGVYVIPLHEARPVPRCPLCR